VKPANPPGGFRFADTLAAADDATSGQPAAHVVRIAAGVRRKRELLTQYDRSLRLPDYFGWNWDALEEVLRDLAWLAEPRRIVVVHADVPFAPRGKNRPNYLALLGDLIAEGAPLVAIFPPAAEADVASALGYRPG
jgi:hypothetical protein